MHSISGTLRLNSIGFKKIIHFDMLVIDWWYQSKITPIPLVLHKYNERLHCGRYWYIPSTVKSNLHLIKIEKAKQVFMQHSSHYVAQLYNGSFPEFVALQHFCESQKIESNAETRVVVVSFNFFRDHSPLRLSSWVFLPLTRGCGPVTRNVEPLNRGAQKSFKAESDCNLSILALISSKYCKVVWNKFNQ